MNMSSVVLAGSLLSCDPAKLPPPPVEPINLRVEQLVVQNPGFDLQDAWSKAFKAATQNQVKLAPVMIFDDKDLTPSSKMLRDFIAQRSNYPVVQMPDNSEAQVTSLKGQGKFVSLPIAVISFDDRGSAINILIQHPGDKTPSISLQVLTLTNSPEELSEKFGIGTAGLDKIMNDFLTGKQLIEQKK